MKGLRFEAMLRRLGADAVPVGLYGALAAAWTEPHRHYHDLTHLDACLGELDTAPADLADRDAAEAALWFHDAVYDPRAEDNEALSAAWAEEALTAAGVPPARAADVARLVLLTRHREVPPVSDVTGALVCDVDLAVLGRPPAAFNEYERRIRREYAWVPETTYRDRRARILTALLDRSPLYRLDHFRMRYEAAARHNLKRSLAALTADPPTNHR